MKKSLSINEWHQLSENGIKLPVKIPLSGWSMYPLIRNKRDIVTVAPLEGLPQVGDIVLFVEMNGERYVMHRVWELKEREALIWGDNCRLPDGWRSLEDIWGKAILIERGRRKIIPDPEKGMKWARFWHKAQIPCRFIRTYKNGFLRRINKMKAWVKK